MNRARSLPLRWRRRAVERLLRGLLTAVDLLLRRWGHQQTYELLRRTSPSPHRGVVPAAREHRARVLARLVTSAAVGRDDTCLRRALVSWWLLRWLGVHTEVRIGLRPGGGRTQAHAWVERSGVPMTDRPDIAEIFPLVHGADLRAEADDGR